MTSKLTTQEQITIGEDIDSFLGSDPAAIATIDIEASQANYELMVATRIKKIYPALNVTFNWGGGSRYTHLLDTDEYKTLQDDLEMIEERVYNSQDFWVVKGIVLGDEKQH